MSSGGGSKSSQSGTSSTDVSIPGFLEPFVRRGASTADRSLTSLESRLGLTGTSGAPAPLNDVRGPNGQPVFLDSSQRAFVDAQGNVVAPFSEGVVPGLTNGTDNPVEVRGGTVLGVGSGGVNELGSLSAAGGFNTNASQDLIAGFSPAQIAAQELGIDRATSGDLFAPTQAAVQDIAAQGVDSSGIRGAAGGGALAGTDALQATADGNFLFGGDGFQAAVDASLRQATPGILSTFGSAGAGGATGGLAQEALGTAAIDAFARQFAQERGNQINAAGLLGGRDLAQRGLGLDAQVSATSAELAGQGNQLRAAQLIPGLATADIDLLSQLGGQQQAMSQQQLDAPRNALLQLLSASLSGTPIESLLGQTGNTDSNSRSLFLGFGG